MRQRHMILPKTDFYLIVCANHEWYELCERAPFKAQRDARKHAERYPGHDVIVFNMTQLSVVRHYRYEMLTADTPPF